jgi:hypothetical protein
MSDASIPKSNGNLKPLTLDGLINLTRIANKAVERANDQLGADSPMRFELFSMPGPGAPTTPAKPKRRRRERKSGLWLVLQSAQEHGITHPTVGGFLQLPREFDAASGSCRALRTDDTRKRWRKRCLPGVTRHDLGLGMSPQKGILGVCSGYVFMSDRT